MKLTTPAPNPTNTALRTAQHIIKAMSVERAALNEARETFGEELVVPQDLAEKVNEWRFTTEVLNQWESVGRQVLAIHEGLVSAIRVASSSKITPEVFRTLPYLNPMVVFPNPPELFSHTKGERIRVLGFMTYGIPEHRRSATTTHDPVASLLGTNVVLEIDMPDGRTLTEFDYMSFPMYGDPVTIKDAVDDMMHRFHWSHGDNNPTSKNRFMRELVSLVIGSLMYLCSTTLEAEKVPRKAVLKALGGAQRQPFSMYRVGWQIGAALSASRKSIKVDDPSQQLKPGYEQDPQHRRAHFKVVWTGEGSMVPKTVFIEPYWTHREKLGVSGVNTVRRVKLDP